MTSTTKAKLSIIIVFKEKNPQLQLAIDSAQFADEIITLHHPHISDFSQIRNDALSKANNEWIMFLDSDEIICPESVVSITNVIEENIVDGVLVRRRDIFHDQELKHGETGQMKLLRLGKKQQLHWERPVHEIAKVNGKIISSKITLYHTAHNSLAEFLSSIINYAALEANYRFNDTNPIIAKFQLVILPIAKFIFNYFLKAGFLDGWRGLSYAIMMSLHSLSVRALLIENHDDKKNI